MRLRPALLASLIGTLACQASEAPRVELPVVVAGSGIEPVTNDLGWTVALTHARIAIADVRFTTAGELHEGRSASLGAQLLGLVLRRAHAHPGHSQGGEVIGELPGEFVLDFVAGDGEQLGMATLIVGQYTAADFLLRRAHADELASDDLLLDHTAVLIGTASKNGQTIEFSAYIDSPDGRELIGAPFDYAIDEHAELQLGVRLLTRDPHEGDTLFDGLDFAALDAADSSSAGVTLIDPELDPQLSSDLQAAYNQLRRTLQTHDHFDVITLEP